MGKINLDIEIYFLFLNKDRDLSIENPITFLHKLSIEKKGNENIIISILFINQILV